MRRSTKTARRKLRQTVPSDPPGLVPLCAGIAGGVSELAHRLGFARVGVVCGVVATHGQRFARAVVIARDVLDGRDEEGSEDE